MGLGIPMGGVVIRFPVSKEKYLVHTYKCNNSNIPVHVLYTSKLGVRYFWVFFYLVLKDSVFSAQIFVYILDASTCM